MEIVSVTNPRVKLWSQLLDKKGRDKQNKFIVEGIHLVKEAIKANVRIECIVYSIDQGIPNEIKYDDYVNCEWIAVSHAVLTKCTDTVTPQGIFAVVHKLTTADDLIIKAANPIVVIIDGVQDPGNLGTIIRSADAVGAAGVVIGKGSVDLYNPKTVRASMGSIFHLPIIDADLELWLPHAGQNQIQMISTSLQARSHCYEIDFKKGTWIVVGNEGQGVSHTVSRFVDHEIIIPMAGQSESLNVAMATTVLLYETLRQRKYSE